VDVHVNIFDTALLFPRGSTMLDSELIGLGSSPVQGHHVLCSNGCRPFTPKFAMSLLRLQMGAGNLMWEVNPVMD